VGQDARRHHYHHLGGEEKLDGNYIPPTTGRLTTAEKTMSKMSQRVISTTNEKQVEPLIIELKK